MIMNDILDRIKRSKEIAISFHISPDGDSLGSALALCQGFRKMGKKAYIMSKELPPYNLMFLPGSESVDGRTVSVLPSTDIVMILDCGDSKRINADINFADRGYALINMDHHLSNEMFGDLNYVDTNASAMAEIAYQMLNLLGVRIDKDIATCLYASIISDTGSFKYSNTTSVTHGIAGHLINAGIDFSEIHRKVFDDKPFERFKFIGRCIDDMELVNNQISVFTITNEDFKRAGIETGMNTSDIIALGLEIDTAQVSVLLKEGDGIVKVSLRSRAYVDVRRVAEKFGGGGHTKASGFVLENVSMDEAKRITINEIEKELI
ncbi:MAG: 1-pyrroline-5-carboxylate dehydrogenase [Firmicutes bacterium]|nr:1-pyrroline-5-carboxylate dehydrogenase [Bacillota bacterium]